MLTELTFPFVWKNDNKLIVKTQKQLISHKNR